MPILTPPGPACRLRFGAESAHVVRDRGGWLAHLPIDVLGGENGETLPLAAGEVFEAGLVRGVKSDDGSVAGLVLVEAGDPVALEAAAAAAYSALFACLGPASLCRVWNLVPDINDLHDGHENYWRFNAGRRRAFEERFGIEGCEAHMPAASAVGWDSPHLFVGFSATTAPVRFVENPNQVPAYRYPDRYGPRPPSFSRGAAVGQPPLAGFVSGTASIHGHETVGMGDLKLQLEVTLGNIETVMDQIGLARFHSIKGYLRYSRDAETVREALAARFGLPGAEALLLQADVCRPDLDVEIEAILGA